MHCYWVPSELSLHAKMQPLTFLLSHMQQRLLSTPHWERPLFALTVIYDRVELNADRTARTEVVSA